MKYKTRTRILSWSQQYLMDFLSKLNLHTWMYMLEIYSYLDFLLLIIIMTTEAYDHSIRKVMKPALLKLYINRKYTVMLNILPSLSCHFLEENVYSTTNWFCWMRGKKKINLLYGQNNSCQKHQNIFNWLPFGLNITTKLNQEHLSKTLLF